MSTCERCGEPSHLMVAGICPRCQPPVLGADHWVETVSGNKVSLSHPDPATIDLDDIAHGLARQARFNGHTPGEPYSVARHSLWVCRYFLPEAPRMALLGLLHDAHEAYLGDIVRPVAHSEPELHRAFKRLKGRLQTAIYAALRVDPPHGDEAIAIRDVDNQALACEARAFMVSRGEDWNLPVTVIMPRAEQVPICPQPWVADKCQFLHEYEVLQGVGV